MKTQRKRQFIWRNRKAEGGDQGMLPEKVRFQLNFKERVGFHL